jgi:hypoxanthine phosphoribosyltransferase
MGKEEPTWKPLITRQQMRERIRELAKAISERLAGEEPVVIGVLNGAVFFYSDLVRELAIPCRIDFIRAVSYGASKESCGEVRFTKDVETEIAGRTVVLVEDIVDTGLTLKRILERLAERGPASVHVCALIDKRERRSEDIRIDYSGFRVEQGFLVGYGLDFNERYRNLPDIYVLD